MSLKIQTESFTIKRFLVELKNSFLKLWIRNLDDEVSNGSVGPVVNVGAADSDGGHFEQDLIITGFRNRPLLEPATFTNNMEQAAKVLRGSKAMKLPFHLET